MNHLLEFTRKLIPSRILRHVSAFGCITIIVGVIIYTLLPVNAPTHCLDTANNPVVCQPDQINSTPAVCARLIDGALRQIPCGINFPIVRLEGWKLLLLMFGAFATAAASWFAGNIFGERNIEAAFSPVSVRPGERKNTILMVGLGRCGKTSLIKALISDGSDEAVKLTQEFDVYKFSNENDGIITKYYITDYKGQTLRQLVEQFIKAQFIRYSDLRYGDVNSLVLVVDLFPWVENEKDDTQYKEIDQERIGEHLMQWSRMAIDATFGLLTSPQLKSVVLFINKFDKWKSGLGATDKEEKISKLFGPIIDDLTERVHPNGAGAADAIMFKVIVGSVLTGQGVSGADGDSLRNILASQSVPISEN